MVNVNDQQQQHRRILNVFESRNVILFINFLCKKKKVKVERAMSGVRPVPPFPFPPPARDV